MPKYHSASKVLFYHLPTRGRAGIKLGDAWYVSNVSIIFDCSMLLYYPFWLFMGFILHIYMVFGTNLLTGGPTRIAVFFPFSVFRRKGISDGVQTEWNLRQRDFLEEYDPGDLESTSEDPREGHEIGARPIGVGVPYPLVAALAASWLALQLLWITFVPKITFPKVSFRLDSVWYSFSAKLWNRQKTAILGWASG